MINLRLTNYSLGQLTPGGLALGGTIDLPTLEAQLSQSLGLSSGNGIEVGYLDLRGMAPNAAARAKPGFLPKDEPFFRRSGEPLEPYGLSDASGNLSGLFRVVDDAGELEVETLDLTIFNPVNTFTGVEILQVRGGWEYREVDVDPIEGIVETLTPITGFTIEGKKITVSGYQDGGTVSFGSRDSVRFDDALEHLKFSGDVDLLVDARGADSSITIFQFPGGGRTDHTLLMADYSAYREASTGNGNDLLIGNQVPYVGAPFEPVWFAQLEGRGGNDVLVSGAGLDRIYGEAGNDILYGAATGDLIYGDEDLDGDVGVPGQDRFVFTSLDVPDLLHLLSRSGSAMLPAADSLVAMPADSPVPTGSLVGDFVAGEDLLVFHVDDLALNALQGHKFGFIDDVGSTELSGNLRFIEMNGSNDVLQDYTLYDDPMFYDFANLNGFGNPGALLEDYQGVEQDIVTIDDVLLRVEQSTGAQYQNLDHAILGPDDGQGAQPSYDGAFEVVYRGADESTASSYDEFEGFRLTPDSGAGTGPLSGQDKFDFTAFGFEGSEIETVLVTEAPAGFTVDDVLYDQDVRVDDFFLDQGVSRAVHVVHDDSTLMVYVDTNKDGDFSPFDEIDLDTQATTSADLVFRVSPHDSATDPYSAGLIADDLYGLDSGGMFIFNDSQYDFWLS